MLFFNTDLHVKFLIVIILIVLEINLFYRILVSGGWGGGGGGVGGGRWLVGAQNSVPSAVVKRSSSSVHW